MHSSAAPCEYVFLGQSSVPVRFRLGTDPAPADEQNDAPATLEYSPAPSHDSHVSAPPGLASPASQASHAVRSAFDLVPAPHTEQVALPLRAAIDPGTHAVHGLPYSAKNLGEHATQSPDVAA